MTSNLVNKKWVVWTATGCLDTRARVILARTVNFVCLLPVCVYGLTLGKKKNLLCCPHPTKIKKLGRSVGIFFFFFFTYRERVEFSNIFFQVSKWGKLGGMQSKRIYKSCKCFLKPLNTNFSKCFAQIWHKKKKKKKKRPCFFAFYGRSGEGNITIFFFGLT